MTCAKERSHLSVVPPKARIPATLAGAFSPGVPRRARGRSPLAKGLRTAPGVEILLASDTLNADWTSRPSNLCSRPPSRLGGPSHVPIDMPASSTVLANLRLVAPVRRAGMRATGPLARPECGCRDHLSGRRRYAQSVWRDALRHRNRRRENASASAAFTRAPGR